MNKFYDRSKRLLEISKSELMCGEDVAVDLAAITAQQSLHSLLKYILCKMKVEFGPYDTFGLLRIMTDSGFRFELTDLALEKGCMISRWKDQYERFDTLNATSEDVKCCHDIIESLFRDWQVHDEEFIYIRNDE